MSCEKETIMYDNCKRFLQCRLATTFIEYKDSLDICRAKHVPECVPVLKAYELCQSNTPNSVQNTAPVGCEIPLDDIRKCLRKSKQ